MHFHYNKPPPSSSSPYLCWLVLRRGAPGCSSRSRVSPPGRHHRFHRPSPVQTPLTGKSVMALGQLTKGANWEELLQACLQSFGKSTLTLPPQFGNIPMKSAALCVPVPHLWNMDIFICLLKFDSRFLHLTLLLNKNKIRLKRKKNKKLKPQCV